MHIALKPEAIIAEIRKNHLFSQLDDDQLSSLAHSIRLFQLEKNEQVFRQDQEAEYFYLLRTGQVKLYRISPDGDEKVIDIIQAGMTFAEAVMFMKSHKYPVHASTLTPCEIFSFNNNVFLDLLRKSVDTCFRMMADMGQRLHHRLNEIDTLAWHDATYRLVSYLLAATPPSAMEIPQVHLSIPKHVIASRLSIKPETLSRIQAKLVKLGLISVDGNDITLRDVDGLRELLHQPT